MMLRFWRLTIVFAVALFAFGVLSAVVLASEPIQMPEGFCGGNIPWVIPDNAMLPNSACMPNSGAYVVDRQPEQIKLTDWAAVTQNIGTGACTLWFELPTAISMPDGFCTANTPWLVPMNSVLPEAACTQPGNYIADVNAVRTMTTTWSVIRQEVGIQPATLYFEPVPQPVRHFIYLSLVMRAPEPLAMPSGFCQGNVPWQVSEGAVLPTTACPEGSGQYGVEVQTKITWVVTWQEAVATLAVRAGTFWFQSN